MRQETKDGVILVSWWVGLGIILAGGAKLLDLPLWLSLLIGLLGPITIGIIMVIIWMLAWAIIGD